MEKRYLLEQIVAALKQAELGLPVADLIRRTDGSGCKEVSDGDVHRDHATGGLVHAQESHRLFHGRGFG
ncbi:hypothetical protein, partial [Sabulicella glaciei]